MCVCMYVFEVGGRNILVLNPDAPWGWPWGVFAFDLTIDCQIKKSSCTITGIIVYIYIYI